MVAATHHVALDAPALSRPRAEIASRAAYVLSLLLVLAAAVACVAAFAVPETIQSPPVSVGNMQGTALVLLCVTLPVLVVSMVTAGRGHRAWIVGWTGALGSVWYQSVLFLFGTPFNAFFHVYVAMLSLSVWSLVVLVGHVDLDETERSIGQRAPRRFVAGYLVVNAVLFGLLWLQSTVPAVLGPLPPTFLAGTGMMTGPVQVIDLAFTLPAMFLAAWLLLRARPWGRLLSGSLLVMLAIETTSIGIDQWVGHAADPASPAASAALTPVFGVLTILGLAVLWLFVRPPARA